MSAPCPALVIDGYPKASRDLFDEVGMTKAYILYERMLRQELPEARVDYFFPSDSEGPPPNTLDNYQMILWTGCNLTVYHQHEATVRNQLALAQKAFDLGIPSFGSCWGLQVAVVAAGGTVKLHPRGREMGVARKIALSPEGQKHPMFRGKNQVFDAFISHDDEVTRLPSNTPVLAGNGYTRVQAAVIRHGKGKKVLVVKRRPRKWFKKNGHRQNYTSLLITSLADGNGKEVMIDKESANAKKHLG